MTTDEIKAEIERLQKLLDEQESGYPKLDQPFWCLRTDGTVSDKYSWAAFPIQKATFDQGNGFFTEQEAKDDARRREIRTRLKRMTKGFVPDWGNNGQLKWYIEYKHIICCLSCAFATKFQNLHEIYFASENDAKAAVEAMRYDLLFLAGVKK